MESVNMECLKVLVLLFCVSGCLSTHILKPVPLKPLPRSPNTCVCFEKQSNVVIPNYIRLSGGKIERTVIYLYKVNNETTVYIPNFSKQAIFPDLSWDVGDHLTLVNSEYDKLLLLRAMFSSILPYTEILVNQQKESSVATNVISENVEVNNKVVNPVVEKLWSVDALENLKNLLEKKQWSLDGLENIQNLLGQNKLEVLKGLLVSNTQNKEVVNNNKHGQDVLRNLLNLVHVLHPKPPVEKSLLQSILIPSQLPCSSPTDPCNSHKPNFKLEKHIKLPFGIEKKLLISKGYGSRRSGVEMENENPEVYWRDGNEEYQPVDIVEPENKNLTESEEDDLKIRIIGGIPAVSSGRAINIKV